MFSRKRTSWLPLLVLGLLSCSKQEVLPTPPEPVKEAPVATYEWISKNVFQTRCVVCHNSTVPRAKVDLSSYNRLMASPGPGGHAKQPIVAGDAENSALYLEVSEQKMPPTPKRLNEAEQKALHDWILAGAPEKTPGVVLPPQGAPNPPQPNYEWLSKNSLRRCGSCHGVPFKVANVDFTSYATLLASPAKELKALVPGDPENSGIFHEVSEGEMPPERHGLTEDEVRVVQQWIQDGAKNN